jgi:hypothetical protein
MRITAFDTDKRILVVSVYDKGRLGLSKDNETHTMTRHAKKHLAAQAEAFGAPPPDLTETSIVATVASARRQ